MVTCDTQKYGATTSSKNLIVISSLFESFPIPRGHFTCVERYFLARRQLRNVYLCIQDRSIITLQGHAINCNCKGEEGVIREVKWVIMCRTMWEDGLIWCPIQQKTPKSWDKAHVDIDSKIWYYVVENYLYVADFVQETQL